MTQGQEPSFPWWEGQATAFTFFVKDDDRPDLAVPKKDNEDEVTYYFNAYESLFGKIQPAAPQVNIPTPSQSEKAA